MDAHPELALLAPVPLVHLEDGAPVCQRRGKVAYGSRAWELFRRLDEARDGMRVETFIYSSHTQDHAHVASWHAYYVGHVEGIGGAHPRGAKFRPPSTLDDGDGYWAVFWEVEGLERIAPIPLSELRGLNAKKNYDRTFVPEGPLMIERP